jgi:hypothetical protein
MPGFESDQAVLDLVVDLEPRRQQRKGRTYINKQVLPQAPSPTITSFRRISAIVADGYLGLKTGESVDVAS